MNCTSDTTCTTNANDITVGIVGLGLIGGSFARAYSQAQAHVLAVDTDEQTLNIALQESVNGVLTKDNLDQCDLIILAAYPGACLEWLQEHAAALGKATDISRHSGPIVIDTAGVKEQLCKAAFAIANKNKFFFVGAHPMAGTQFSGYLSSKADLFCNSPMVLVPPSNQSDEYNVVLERIKRLLDPCGFGSFSITTPQIHDEVISFTSQLAHVVSNAYVKSPTAQFHHGFSAGSYLDLTRVAHLNADMWTELMSDNAQFLSQEIATLIENLEQVRIALEQQDRDGLCALLSEGDRIKRSLDDKATAERSH